MHNLNNSKTLCGWFIPLKNLHSLYTVFLSLSHSHPYIIYTCILYSGCCSTTASGPSIYTLTSPTAGRCHPQHTLNEDRISYNTHVHNILVACVRINVCVYKVWSIKRWRWRRCVRILKPKAEKLRRFAVQ